MTMSETTVRAWRALMHAHSAVTTAIDETLRREVGIPGSWYEALVEIALAGGDMRMHEFALETTLTKSGATRFADRLQAAGFVERKTCPTDRRSWLLVITEAGRRVQRAADPHVLSVIQDCFGRFLNEEEAATLLGVLSRLRKTPVTA